MKTGIGIIFVFLCFCPVVAAVSAQDMIVSEKTVMPEKIFVYGGGCAPDTTTVTLEVNGYGGGGGSDTLAVVFAIDSSGSMSWTDPSERRLSAATAFIDNLCMTPENDRAGIVSWDDDVDFTYGLVSENDDSFKSLKESVNRVNSAGNTNLDEGLRASIAMMDDDDDVTKQIVIFLTDGSGVYTPSGNPGSPADEAAAKDITIYTIGLNIIPCTHIERKMMEIARVTGGSYYPIPVTTNLDAVFADIYAGVASTAPYSVNLTEVTEPYIVEEADFSIRPDSVVENGDGTTMMTWTNIARHVGNGNARLDATETFVISYTAGSDVPGTALPVGNLCASEICYMDPVAGELKAPVGQGYLDVIDCVMPTPTTPTPVQTPVPSHPPSHTSVPEFPAIVLPLGIIISLIAAAFMLRR